MSRSGSPRWRRSPTRRSRWPWRWWCGRCATGRCVWTCGRSQDQVGVDGLPWPEVDEWLAAVRASPLAGQPPVLRVDGDLLYLDRYWLEEQQVCDDVLRDGGGEADAGVARHRPAVSRGIRGAARGSGSRAVARIDGADGRSGDGQDDDGGEAVGAARRRQPGCGSRWRRRRARRRRGCRRRCSWRSAKLDPADRAALSGLHATTLHRLLGSRPDTSARFRHHRGNRLPHDVIVVDETSMVSLTMMARLLEAVRPDARLILVGDPDQLASVEAGAVLADLVDGLGEAKVAALKTSHRFGESIGALASAIRAGDADRVDRGAARRRRAHRVDRHRRAGGTPAQCGCAACAFGCARRRSSVTREEALADAGRASAAVRASAGPVRGAVLEPAGRAVAGRGDGRADLVVVVRGATGAGDGQRLRAGAVQRRHGRHGAARRRAAGGDCRRRSRLEFATSRLADVDTMHAMTIHKSQGSQADEVTVLLPPEDSRLLTRELFYTGVTRAKKTHSGDRLGGVGAGGGRTPGGARVGAEAATARLTPCAGRAELR